MDADTRDTVEPKRQGVPRSSLPHPLNCMLHRYAALAPVECPALTACEPACAPSRSVSGHARTRSASPHTPCIHIHLMAASWGRHGLPTRSRSRNGFTRPPPGSYCSTWARAHGGRTSGIGRPHVWPTHPDHLWPLLSPCGSTRPVRASRKISIAADPPPKPPPNRPELARGVEHTSP